MYGRLQEIIAIIAAGFVGALAVPVHEPGDSDDPCEHGCSHRVRRCRKGCEVEPEKERDQCLLGCEFEHQECVEGCRK